MDRATSAQGENTRVATQVNSQRHSDWPHPTGTVTFLFTDIQGSTQRWERNRDAMDAALERHNAIFRAAIEAHDGYVFKTVGDAFCAAFARPEKAIAAALDAQRLLLSEDFSAIDGLPVRIALHTGMAKERDGDYFGPAVNRVARLLAIGHGSQVLLSGAAAELLHGEMPDTSALRDLGQHQLKDLGRCEHVYQLIAPGLPETFPALRSLDALPNNLPRQLTSFVGREDVLQHVKSLLAKSPLVTLVGTGGAGKTRCALQAGAELLDGSADGVWLVELAPISDSSLVASAIAQILNLQTSPTRPILETLVTYLARKRMVLIIDNCEHVIEEVRTIAGALLRACAQLRILATSREALNVAGEELYLMPSLDVPQTAKTVTAADAARYGAAQLFIDRAIAVDKRFSLTDDNASSVAEICRRLDGIPLAIELAAARVKVLSTQQLARKLNERFRVLTGGDRSALPRQQTMRALIDWSYDLLSEEERALFRKLSIFAGGFTLESATAVCASDDIDEMAVLDGVSSLVDKSLVQADPTDGETRYRLLESTREYAREKLVASGEFEPTAHAHAAAYLALADELDASDDMPDAAWQARAEPELENWRATLEWTLAADADIVAGQRLAAALRRVWGNFGIVEGARWVRLAQDKRVEETPPDVCAKLDLAEASLFVALHQFKAAYEAAERALTRFRALGDAHGTAWAERHAGFTLVLMERGPEGEALLEKALLMARELRLRRLTPMTLRDLGMARDFAGDLAAARSCFAEALTAYRATGDERGAATVAASLGEAEFRRGDTVAALRFSGESLSAHRALPAGVGEQPAAIDLSNISAYLIALGNYEDASMRAREALALFRDVQDSAGTAFVLQHLAAVGALRTNPDAAGAQSDRGRAARLLGFVDGCLAALQVSREYTEKQEYDKTLVALRDALGAHTLSKVMDEGRTWSEDQAVAEALLV